MPPAVRERSIANMDPYPTRPDGVLVRAATDDDVPAIAGLYRSLSDHSVQMRFSTTVSPETARQVAHLRDGTIALVAVDGGQLVAEARLEVATDGHELGLTVADSHHRRGLGRRLLQQLRTSAKEQGIESFGAEVRVDNAPMLRLLQSVGCAVVRPAEGGVVSLEVATDVFMPGWAPVTPGRRTAPRVLVEARSVFPTPQTAALRAAGYDVRQCLGPGGTGRAACALLTEGRCRLVEQADMVACLLPQDDAECRDVVTAHGRSTVGPDEQDPDAVRPGRVPYPRLVARSRAEWERAVADLVATPVGHQVGVPAK